MAIEYLDGLRLYKSLSVGLKRVVAHQEYLNKINVFPVPDSDTGTNMAYTLLSIEDGINNQIHAGINKMSAAIADAALDGARGNSGAILAQFFVGFSEGVNDDQKLSAIDFGNALQVAKTFAYDALAKPQEGTILSVMSEWVDEVHKNSNVVNDFRDLLAKSLKKAKEALQHTPEKLEVLAKAGVVDAGGQGFVDLLDGIQEFIDNGSITDLAKIRIADITNNSDATIDEKFRYCTECTITGTTIDRVTLKQALIANGDSLVLAGTKKKAKVHIHTNEPKTIIKICEEYGLVSGEKADDMLRQQKDAHKQHAGIALVVDSGCDLPEELMEELDIHVVPVRINFGDKHYVDKITMTTAEFWAEIDRNPIHPKTSQPAPGDFKRQYQFLASHYHAAISLHLPAAASGTFQSALMATKSLRDFPVHVMDSCNGTIGQGLIAWRVAEAIQTELSVDKVINIATQAIANTQMYIGLDTLDNAVLGGRIPAAMKTIATLLRINPILTINKDGVKAVDRTFGHNNKFDKFRNYILKQIPKQTPFRVGVGHVQNEAVAESFVAKFNAIVGPSNVLLSEVGPALSVHAGRKAIFVAIQTLNDDLS